MKAKKFLPALALTLGIACLAGCSAGDQKLEFGHYWNQSSLGYQDIDETLVYDVNFEAGSGASADSLGYALSYETGTYTTRLHSITVDGKAAYEYTSTLEIEVSYKLGNDEKTFIDKTESKVIFLSSEASLRPLESHVTILNHSPASAAGSTVESCYSELKAQIDTKYDAEGNGDCKITQLSNKKSFSYDFEMDEDITFIDKEQLILAMRALNSSVSAGSIQFYNPFAYSVQTVNFTFASASKKKFDYVLNGEAVSRVIDYRPVTITINANNPGPSQTMWIATASNNQNNVNRNVMLRMETPYAYNMGKMVYELKEVTR